MSTCGISTVQQDSDVLRYLVTTDFPEEAATLTLAGVSVQGDEVTISGSAPRSRSYANATSSKERTISAQAINGLPARLSC